MNALLFLAALLLATGCGGRSAKRAGSSVPGTGTDTASVRLPPAAEGADAALEASLRGGGFAALGELAAARFGYDSAELDEGSRAVLKANAAWLREHPDVEVLVEGHCDERGTSEYNLALGQRRAQRVRDYYRNLGLSARRLATISYGEESPACRESNEACWAANRRAETKVRTLSSRREP